MSEASTPSLLALATIVAAFAVTAGHPAGAASPERHVMEQSDRDVPRPKAVSFGGTRYEALRNARKRGFPQSGGVVVATEAASQRELWTLKVYDVAFDPDEERDVQEVYITQLRRADAEHLEVTNERGETFLIKLSDQSITRVETKPPRRKSGR